MTNKKNFPGYLRQLIADAGLTRTELAKRAGISRYTINKLATDPSHSPTAETLTAIARVLRMPVSDLYRAAGLQPERVDSWRVDRAVHLFSQLSDFDQDEVIEILELKVKRREAFTRSIRSAVPGEPGLIFCNQALLQLAGEALGE